MLKRVKYVSRQVRAMSETEIDALVRSACEANLRQDVTGALVVAENVFFQVIEGHPPAIDRLFAKIRADARHTDVVCVAEQEQCEIRLFPAWSMRRCTATPAVAQTMERLVRQLPGQSATARTALADELAGLMRDSLRAA